MNNKKATKRALLTSVMALAMCVVMLVGTTFAWFTDTARTGVNTIKSGTLKVDIVDGNNNSLKGKTLNWVKAQGHEDEEVLWEPGAKYNLTPFKIVNKGNLALEYEITINGVTGDAKLLNAIDFTATMGSQSVALSELKGILLPKGAAVTAGTNEEEETSSLITITGEMKKGAGNEYQGLSIDGISITVVATQYTYEYDSNGNQYDVNAKAEINVNSENIQDYLDGKYGAIDGMTLVLAEGNYGTLELGRATAYEGSNTKYYTFKGNPEEITEYDTAEALKTALADTNVYHGNLRYIRSLSNVTFKAAEGATVNIAGVTMISGYIYLNGRDYVLGRDVENNVNAYNLVHQVNGIKFKGLHFTGMVTVYSSLSETKIDGISFEECTFTGTDTTVTKGMDISSEHGVAAISGVDVKNCKFNTLYQGVYTRNIRNVSVTNSEFENTGHNAIAIQDGDTFNHGTVVITDNTFNIIHNRIIRFDKVGADTQITIKSNMATNSGDSSGEVIKATSLADGITYDISGNRWGDGAVVVNDQLKDKTV